MAAKLTRNQEQVYLFVRRYILENKRAPYIREIQEDCHVPSHKVVIDRLNALERKGYIRRKLNQHRGIRLRNHLAYISDNGVTQIQNNQENGGKSGLEE